MKLIKFLYNFLTLREKKFLIKLVPLDILNSLIELFSIGLIFTLVALYIKGENINLPYLDINLSIDNDLNYIVLAIIFLFIIKTILSITIIWLKNLFSTNIYSRVSSDLFGSYMNSSFLDYQKKNPSTFTKSISQENIAAKNVYFQSLIFLSELLIILSVTSLLIIFSGFEVISIIIVLVLFSLLFIYISKKKVDHFAVARDKSIEEVYFKGDNYINSFINIRINQLFNKVLLDFLDSVKNFCKSSIFFETFSASTKIILELFLVTGMMFFLLILLNFDYSKNEILFLLSLIFISTVRLMPILNKLIISSQTIRYWLPTLKSLNSKLKKKSVNNLKLKIKSQNYSLKNNIKISNVFFRFETNRKNTLENINLKIKKSDKVILLGNTGSGKTTFLNLLMGLINPSKGKIKIDNLDLKNKEYLWHQNVDYVSQSTKLLDTTVAENIRFFYPHKKNNRELNEIAKILDIYDILNKRTGHNGKLISGGQAQRIGIARALYGGKNTIILDEATNALDIKLEKKILGRLFRLNKTIIFVTHRFTFKFFIKSYYLLENKKLKKMKVSNV